MISARGEVDGAPLLLLGLSKLNIERLMAGKPIKLNGNAVGFNGEIIIMYGETEEAMKLALSPAIDKDTVIRE